MSGGHWNYLSLRIEERIGASLDDAWRLLAAIEHELDWGICCDTCYDCAKIRTINALEAYFDTEARSADDALRLLHSSEPECERCKAWRNRGKEAPKQERTAAQVEVTYEWKTYKGTVYAFEEGKES